MRFDKVVTLIDNKFANDGHYLFELKTDGNDICITISNQSAYASEFAEYWFDGKNEYELNALKRLALELQEHITMVEQSSKGIGDV